VKEKHLNHVGVVYAGTQFMLMEISGAALFFCTFSFMYLSLRMDSPLYLI